ncbi:ABC transporter permease [Actinomadura opuntiae]|uniref:ABC transporter permease n=1 Tax=Actinomadura sp. OS1-43 TaxID=604315 RepID=UPI00255B19F6|nr:ABC transporter permease [Actinomadura sp. OS1-43]MDL4813944.1 ABC transporter permease [Actinomadura sp. OS1-43]
MTDAIAAEWWKLRSVRSTYTILAITAGFVVFVVLLAFQQANVWDHLDSARRARFDLRPLQELGGWVAQLCLAVLGVLAATSEYRTGMVRTSLTAVPSRTRFLAAKAAVVGATGLVAGEAVAVGSLLGTRLVIGGRPFPDQGASIAHDLPGFLVSGAAVAVFALLGLALGVLLRSAAGAIVAVVLLWHVIPLLVYHLPGPWNERVGSLMPSGLSAEIAGLSAEHSIYGGALSPPTAAVVLVAYALVPLALAGLVLVRRDA